MYEKWRFVKIEGMEDRCFHCFEPGHKYSNCPERRNDDGEEEKEDTASESSQEVENVSKDEDLSQSIQEEELSTSDTLNPKHTLHEPQHSTHKHNLSQCNTSPTCYTTLSIFIIYFCFILLVLNKKPYF